MAMNICPLCNGMGILFRTMHDMKKGEWGWCSVLPCDVCAQTGVIDDEEMIQYCKRAALQDVAIQIGSVA